MLIQKIKHHLFLEDTWPAILLEDGQLSIMIQTGRYMGKEEFMLLVAELSISMPEDKIIILKNYYEKDWSDYLEEDSFSDTHIP